MDTNRDDIKNMELALEQARLAAAHDEVPVGAVVVRGDEVIGRGHNLTRRLQDATAHAEMTALRDAAERLGHWYFEGCTMYVTVEPCVMCTGALLLGRMERLVYGAREPKFGACGSLYGIPEDSRLNHHMEVRGGVLAGECSELMKSFFRALREK